MEEVHKLIDYSYVSGFGFRVNGNQLIVKNGVNLPPELRRLLKLYKSEIIEILETNEKQAS